jgi:hypothetical protein
MTETPSPESAGQKIRATFWNDEVVVSFDVGEDKSVNNVKMRALRPEVNSIAAVQTAPLEELAEFAHRMGGQVTVNAGTYKPRGRKPADA